MRWEFGPEIPTHDFLEEGPLDNTWNLQEAVASFVWWLEKDQFPTWEAIVCEEQGLALTAEQKEALQSLISFNDEPDDQIFIRMMQEKLGLSSAQEPIADRL